VEASYAVKLGVSDFSVGDRQQAEQLLNAQKLKMQMAV